MQPSILISGASGSARTAIFSADGERPVTVFAAGLSGAETVAVELQADTAGSTFVAVDSGGSALALSTSKKTAVLTGPGIYRLSIASSAAAVSIGIYG